MLDKKTMAVLNFFKVQCQDESYKVIEKQDIIASLPSNTVLDVAQLDSIVKYLTNFDYIIVKYQDEEQICLTTTPKTVAAVESKCNIVEGKAKVSKVSYFAMFLLSFFGAGAGATLGVVLAKFLGI